MKNQTIHLVIAAMIGSHLDAHAEDIEILPVTVQASGFEKKDTETTYAAEIHTEQQIAASGASTLYDFLSQQTSLNILSYNGNKATPAINLRGYGNENGFQNVVIIVDGRRLNNIDLQPALLAGIPISNIERIEISKGSGSVLYGDGAMAGLIQIFTKSKTGATLSTSAGNYGQRNHYATAGISTEKWDLSANLSHDSHDGYANKDASGHRDTFSSDTQNIKLNVKPSDSLQLHAQATHSDNDIRYTNPLTKAQFDNNPKTAVGTYTHQTFDTNQWQLGADYHISDNLNISATHYREDKSSHFITFASEFRYDYEMDEAKMRYRRDGIQWLAGYQHGTGVRKSVSNDTSKDFDAWFVSGEYIPEWQSNLTLSAGYRTENVAYRYQPDAGNRLSQNNRLQAWDIGTNYRFSDTFSVFANLNHAYQAPDVDRFFTFLGAFNNFIKPAEVDTLNIGLNHVSEKNKLKFSMFYADLDNEIYLVPGIFKNTNIDQSHKLGLEVQDVYQMTDALRVSVIYNYVKAIIDRENDGGGAYKNKNLPGVPRHSVVANLNWQIQPDLSVQLNQNWRSTAYAFNDFANNFSQKQSQYMTTNLAINYRYQKLTFFGAINNLFDRENRIQVQDDAIYPVDFVRTIRVGLRADF